MSCLSMSYIFHSSSCYHLLFSCWPLYHSVIFWFSHNVGKTANAAVCTFDFNIPHSLCLLGFLFLKKIYIYKIAHFIKLSIWAFAHRDTVESKASEQREPATLSKVTGHKTLATHMSFPAPTFQQHLHVQGCFFI